MLQIDKRRITEQAIPEENFASLADLYAAVIGFLRRQFAVIGFVVLLTLGLGAVYIFTTQPLYTGHAVLVIDAHKSQFFQPDSPIGEIPIDSSTVDTQLEILKSENIGLSVIKDLHLTQDPEFASPRAGLVGTAIGVLANALSFALPAGNKDEEFCVRF